MHSPTDLDLPARYLALFNSMEKLLELYTPDAVAVETQFVYKNVQSALKLGMARGVIIIAAARRGIPIFEYAPKKAKLAVVGNGAASKEQVQRMIQLLLKLPELPEPEDAADALALAICHAHSVKYLERLNIILFRLFYVFLVILRGRFLAYLFKYVRRNGLKI